MAKRLVIAEKPSVAADIARALGGLTRQGDYFEGDDTIVSSAVGHLLEIGMPEEEIRAAADGRPGQLDDEAALIWDFGQQIARDVQASEESTGAVLDLLGRRQATELAAAAG